MDGFKVEVLNDKHTEEIRKKSLGKTCCNPDAIIYPPGCVLNRKFATRLDQIQNFVVYPDDTWVVTFPKCGTTWTQEMVWLLKNGLDFDKAKATPLGQRFPFLELEAVTDPIADPSMYPRTVELAAATPRPRCIKSHLPLDLLPKQLWTVKPKIVYVSRNPKDAMISYYHHHRLWNGYVGTLENFIEAFIADRVVYAPYWDHVKKFYARSRASDHVLFNAFEDMKKNLGDVVLRTASFLNVSIARNQLDELCEHLSFEKMKDNESVNYSKTGSIVMKMNNMQDPGLKFFRSGKLGGWKEELDPAMIERIDEWTSKHLSGTEWADYPW